MREVTLEVTKEPTIAEIENPDGTTSDKPWELWAFDTASEVPSLDDLEIKIPEQEKEVNLKIFAQRCICKEYLGTSLEEFAAKMKKFDDDIHSKC